MTSGQRSAAIAVFLLACAMLALGTAGVILLDIIGEEDSEDPNNLVPEDPINLPPDGTDAPLKKSPVSPASAIASYGTNRKLDRIADRCAGKGEPAAKACLRLALLDMKLPANAEPEEFNDYQDYGWTCGERPGRPPGCVPEVS